MAKLWQPLILFISTLTPVYGDIDHVAFRRGTPSVLKCRLGDIIPEHSYTWYVEGEVSIDVWCQRHYWHCQASDDGNFLTVKPHHQSSVKTVIIYCRDNTTDNVVRLQKLERKEFRSLLSGPHEVTSCPLYAGYWTTLTVKNIAEIESLECAWSFTPSDSTVPSQKFHGETLELSDDGSGAGEYEVKCMVQAEPKSKLMMTFDVHLGDTSDTPLSSQYCVYDRVEETTAALAETDWTTWTSSEEWHTQEVTSLKMVVETPTALAREQEKKKPSQAESNTAANVQPALQFVTDTLKNFSPGSVISALDRLKELLTRSTSSPQQEELTEGEMFLGTTASYKQPQALASVAHMKDQDENIENYDSYYVPAVVAYSILFSVVPFLLVFVIMVSKKNRKLLRKLRKHQNVDSETGTEHEMCHIVRPRSNNLYVIPTP